MKTLKTLALATVAFGFITSGAYAADACDLGKELATLQAAYNDLASKAADDASKAKAAQLAQQIEAIKKEADKAKACKMAEEVKKSCGIR